MEFLVNNAEKNQQQILQTNVPTEKKVISYLCSVSEDHQPIRIDLCPMKTTSQSELTFVKRRPPLSPSQSEKTNVQTGNINMQSKKNTRRSVKTDVCCTVRHLRQMSNQSRQLSNEDYQPIRADDCLEQTTGQSEQTIAKRNPLDNQSRRLSTETHQTIRADNCREKPTRQSQQTIVERSPA